MRILILFILCAAFAAAQVPCVVDFGPQYDAAGKLIEKKISVADCDRDVKVGEQAVIITVREGDAVIQRVYPNWYYLDAKVVRQEPYRWKVSVTFKYAGVCTEVPGIPTDVTCPPNVKVWDMVDKGDIRFLPAGLELIMYNTFKAPNLFWPWSQIEKVEVAKVE